MSVQQESTIESARPRLILGLGNPGERYQGTRHNYGFAVIDALAARWGLPSRDECTAVFFEAGAIPAEQRASDEIAITCDLAKPMTYMNRSGFAARCLSQRFGYLPADVLVVYDEIALPLGSQRLRAGGSPAGHRGLESVLENLQTDQVPRLRLGIADEESFDDDLVEYVLAPFDADQQQVAAAAVDWAADACEAWLRYGIDRTMNQFNGTLPDRSAHSS